MASFELATAGRILFGEGKVAEVPNIAAGLGSQVFLVSGCTGDQETKLVASLESKNLKVQIFGVRNEPDIDLILRGVEQARATGCDMVVALGGGSAIDTGKAVAAMLTNPGELLDYLEVVGKNQPLRQRPVPMIAVPTTAGTGSEVTRNAVLYVPKKGIKVSLRSTLMLPSAAVIDPELTYDLPPTVTASTGMDALCQVIEPYVSRRANAMTDLYCREGIHRASGALKTAFQNGHDTQARADMAFASLMGGLALANAGLGAVHGFAGPIGGMFKAPHGAVCAALLPPVVEANARALRDRAFEHPALARYTEIASLVTGRPDADVFMLVDWLRETKESLSIPGLKEYSMTEKDILRLVEASILTSSMKANPIDLMPDELAWILKQAL